MAKGMRMAGRMGTDRVTVRNLKVLAVDAKAGEIIVSGAVPGTGLVGPEFGIHSASTALNRLNYLQMLIEWDGVAPDASIFARSSASCARTSGSPGAGTWQTSPSHAAP